MKESAQRREEWRRAFAAALAPLAASVTGRGWGLPELSNANYRMLARQALSDEGARNALDRYVTDIDGDPTEAIDLVRDHPSVGAIFSGEGTDTATFALMPGRGFRMELKDLARHAATMAAKRDEHCAAADIDEFLSASGEGRLPGFEAAVIRGVATAGTTDLGPGTRLVSYEEAVKLGLLRDETDQPVRHGPDYRDLNATVLVRAMTWSPCLVAPNALKTPLNPDGVVEHAVPSFAWDAGPPLWILQDLLSMVAEQRIDLLSISSCAPNFVQIDPGFGPGSGTSFRYADWLEPKELTTGHADAARRLYEHWSRFRVADRQPVELALARLVSAVRRGRGRFWLEDRVLDVAVALEVMFGLDGGELTHKLATRCAWLVGKDADERVDAYDGISRFYEVRSAVIHGRGKRKRRRTREDIEEAARQGYEIGRDALVALLERGRLPDWKRLSLSAERCSVNGPSG